MIICGIKCPDNREKCTNFGGSAINIGIEDRMSVTAACLWVSFAESLREICDAIESVAMFGKEEGEVI